MRRQVVAAAVGLLTLLLSLVGIASPARWARGMLAFERQHGLHATEILLRLLLGSVLGRRALAPITSSISMISRPEPCPRRMSMRHALLLCLLLPTLAPAQPALQTEFPPAATPLASEALKKLLTGRTFLITPAAGAEMRLEYRDAYAYINIGNRSDSGKWRVEGSAACIDWQVFPAGCSEVRVAGDVIYTKRASNGEVVVMRPR
jgi:hypothetical protein